MKKCVIFGAGTMGQRAFYKISENYEIQYYIDNDIRLWGGSVGGIRIISPTEFEEKILDKSILIVVSCMAYREIVSQLREMGYYNIKILLEGLLYEYEKDNLLIPDSNNKITYFRKRKKEKNILFVQNRPCIRTNKIAMLMKQKGYKVYLLYTEAPTVDKSKEYEEIYNQVFTVWTQAEIVEFVNRSEFDILHCSNAPDCLGALLVNSNKPMVYDCHDMESLQGKNSLAILTLEHIVNTQSEGVIYTSDGVKDIAIKKFGREDKDIFVLENMIMKQLDRKNYSKLSKKDGEIHCVYEGGINGKDINSDRYFENIWNKIVAEGIHIHFYSQSDEHYCLELEKKSKYLHYEGNKSTKELVSEMTKYDCGLAVFNVNSSNQVFLETGTANKMYEYINAGLPVLVGNVQSYIDFVNRYNVGMYLDLNSDIYRQIEKACKLKIEDDFLEAHSLTMESKLNELEKFYQKIIDKYNL